MRRSVRALDWLLTLTLGGLWFATFLLVPAGFLVLTGRVSLTLDATLDRPYVIELPDGRRIAVTDEGGTSLAEGASGEEEVRFLADVPPSVHTSAKVDRDDKDARALAMAWLTALLGLAWFGWINLQRVVRSARADRPFHPRNPVRLRCLAGLVLAGPLVAWAMSRSLDAVLDTDPPMHVAMHGPGWWFTLIVGLGLLALSQVFAEGARLRELERTTI